MSDEIHSTVIKPIQQDVIIITQGGPQGSTVCSVCFSFNDTPILSSEQTPAYTADYLITLSAIQSRASCEVPATGTAVFTISKNNTTIGTITFSPGSYSGTIVLTNTSLAIGDRLKLIAPNVADVTLFSPSITISGNR